MSAAIAAWINMMGSLASTSLNDRANQRNEAALTAAVNKELARQGVYGQQAMAMQQQNQSASTPGAQQKQVAKGAQDRGNAYAGAAAQPMTGKGLGVSPDVALNSGILNSLLRGSQARLGGWGDAAVTQQIGNSRTNQGIDIANNFSRASAALVPGEFQQSQTAGDKYKMWANIIKSLTNMGSSMAA